MTSTNLPVSKDFHSAMDLASQLKMELHILRNKFPASWNKERLSMAIEYCTMLQNQLSAIHSTLD